MLWKFLSLIREDIKDSWDNSTMHWVFSKSDDNFYWRVNCTKRHEGKICMQIHT